MSNDLPAPVRSAIDVWSAVHDELAPGVVEGLYLVGSAALDDWRPRSDIDVVVVVADPTDAATVEALERAHGAARAELGADVVVDGPRLGWADVVSPPAAVQRAWTLDGEFHFDGECFDINPITWFVLATHGVAVRGAAPGDLDVHLDVVARRTWVRENTDTYWRGVHESVVAALAADPDRTEFDGATQEWCALGIARMAFTFDTGDVASKTAAGRWAAEHVVDHAAVLAEAVALRQNPTAGTVDRTSVVRVASLLGDVVDRITGTDAGRPAGGSA